MGTSRRERTTPQKLLTIGLFGSAGFAFGQEPWRFAAPPRTLPLLAYLILHRLKPVPRDITLTPGRYVLEAGAGSQRYGCTIEDVFSGEVSRVRIALGQAGATPGAEVVIDQGKTGVHTPGSVTLAPGQHLLTLRSPNPKEFKDRSLTITIVAGKSTRLTLDLVHVPR